MKVIDCFAGIGGFSLAAEFLNWDTTDMVEINPFCQQVLAKNFPNARIHTDILTYRGQRGSHEILTGGFPCQDLSLAKLNREGLQGDRSSLFFEVGRVIHEILPRGFCLENVPGIYPWLGDVLAYFAQIGLYELRWFSLRVDQLGGVHRRRRVFILGKLANTESSHGSTSRSQDYQGWAIPSLIRELAVNDTNHWESQSRLCREHDGLSDRLDGYLLKQPELKARLASSLKSKEEWRSPLDNNRLTALGNAVTPQQAYIALSTLQHWLEN